MNILRNGTNFLEKKLVPFYNIDMKKEKISKEQAEELCPWIIELIKDLPEGEEIGECWVEGDFLYIKSPDGRVCELDCKNQIKRYL